MLARGNRALTTASRAQFKRVGESGGLNNPSRTMPVGKIVSASELSTVNVIPEELTWRS